MLGVFLANFSFPNLKMIKSYFLYLMSSLSIFSKVTDNIASLYYGQVGPTSLSLKQAFHREVWF
jgi:hypothetical protein